MSAAWSQYVPERAELVDDPTCDAKPLFWDRKRPGVGARLDGAKFARD
jgi:hypothetical protein